MRGMSGARGNDLRFRRTAGSLAAARRVAPLGALTLLLLGVLSVLALGAPPVEAASSNVRHVMTTPFNSSMPGSAVTSPSTTTHGFWLVGNDGGIFTFGSAQFYGSMGGTVLQRPVVGIVATKDDGGNWLDASDGGVFSFGDTTFYGSIPGLGLHPAGLRAAQQPQCAHCGHGALHRRWRLLHGGLRWRRLCAFGDANLRAHAPGRVAAPVRRLPSCPTPAAMATGS